MGAVEMWGTGPLRRGPCDGARNHLADEGVLLDTKNFPRFVFEIFLFSSSYLFFFLNSH